MDPFEILNYRLKQDRVDDSESTKTHLVLIVSLMACFIPSWFLLVLIYTIAGWAFGQAAYELFHHYFYYPEPDEIVVDKKKDLTAGDKPDDILNSINLDVIKKTEKRIESIINTDKLIEQASKIMDRTNKTGRKRST